jgi:hypothetical protein
MSLIRQTNSKKDRTQHFIQGIGDGNLFSDFDLPPDSSQRRHYIRTSQQQQYLNRLESHNRNRRKDKGNDSINSLSEDDFDRNGRKDDNAVRSNDVGIVVEGDLNEKEGTDGNTMLHYDEGNNPRRDNDLPDSNILFQNLMVITLIPLAALLLAVAFRKEYSRRSYKKNGPDRKLQRTESQVLRQKKKTDDWEDELDTEYSELITRRQSIGESNLHNINNNNVSAMNPPSPRCYRRESFLRTEHARQRKVGVSDSRNVLLDPSYHDIKAQEESFRRMQVSSFDNDDLDEEALSPIVRSRALSLDDFEHTPTVVGSRKPIYVSSFSELTMPDLSSHTNQIEDNVSISDGNAKISENDATESVHSQECATSGETEGANGLIHKRRDLTACSDAASSLHSPIAYSDLKMNHLIGGGGFGQVWSATWRGTPVAVKVLSASSESLMVQKAILQEFVAEINMLSGMRHPNICLYIGACLEPTNRAIVTGESDFYEKY